MLRITINPRRIAVVLVYSIAFLAAAHLLVTTFQVYWPTMLGLVHLFDMDKEGNAPTFFSIIQLLTAGLLLTIIALFSRKQHDRQWWGWALLAVSFLMMSVDESAQIHEQVVRRLVAGIVGPGVGIWFYLWYVAYVPLLVALLLICIPFFRSLPGRYLTLFSIAGVVFIGGAVGAEMAGSYLAYNQLDARMMNIGVLIEESCEMAGVALFIYALLCYMGEKRFIIELNVQPDASIYRSQALHMEA